MSAGTVRRYAADAFRGMAVATAFLLVLLAAAEIALRMAEWGEPPSDRGYPRGYFARGPAGISRAAPGRWRVATTTRDTGDVIYDVHYTIDEFGKRATPEQPAATRDAFAMFFGCSFTMGEGVEDDETFAYYVGELAPRYTPYNFGFHGDGPFDALAVLDASDLPRQVSERRGVGIYTFIDDHINRVNDTWTISPWHGNYPYYELGADGSFVRNGSFRSARPVRSFLYRTVYEVRVLRLIGVRLPLRAGSQRLDLTAAALAAIERRFHERFPETAFYVVLYPGSDSRDSMTRRLDALGVRCLDYRELFPRTDERYRLPFGDNHPTPEANRLLAEALVRDLNLAAGR